MKDRYVIGSRGSDLALWQARFVKARLEAALPNKQFQIKIISTTGDEVADTALSKIGDKGLFTRQIENELLDGKIDLAVHSLKDLQTEQPAGLIIGAVCERETPNDVFISPDGKKIDDLPKGARIATGSLRRRSQLLAYRPDIEVENIRGNVPTRLRKLDESDLDGIILAYAGIQRLGFSSRISEVIPFGVMLPAVGQGAVAVEIRESDEETSQLAMKLDHPTTRICITAEREFLRRLEGGCQVPIGAIAVLQDEKVTLEGMVGSRDGFFIIRESIEGGADGAKSLGGRLAELLIEKGANSILASVREEVARSAEGVM